MPKQFIRHKQNPEGNNHWTSWCYLGDPSLHKKIASIMQRMGVDQLPIYEGDPNGTHREIGTLYLKDLQGS